MVIVAVARTLVEVIALASANELMAAKVPCVFLPQVRIADDQLERVQRAVNQGVGLLAANWEEAVEMAKTPFHAIGFENLVPHNGAASAAIETLSLWLPKDDLVKAKQTLNGDVLRWLRCVGCVANTHARVFNHSLGKFWLVGL